MENTETVGFCYVEKYCVKCGEKEGYNKLKPFSTPVKCKKCGGRMTDKSTEENINFIKNEQKHLNIDIDEYIKKQKEDRED